MGKKAKKQRQDSKKKAKKHNQQKNATAPDSITAIFKVKRPDSHGPSCSASHLAAQPVIQLQKKSAAPETRPQTPPLRRRCCSPPVFVRTSFHVPSSTLICYIDNVPRLTPAAVLVWRLLWRLLLLHAFPNSISKCRCLRAKRAMREGSGRLWGAG